MTRIGTKSSGDQPEACRLVRPLRARAGSPPPRRPIGPQVWMSGEDERSAQLRRCRAIATPTPTSTPTGRSTAPRATAAASPP